MAIVINEFEVLSEPAAPPAQPAQAGTAGSPDMQQIASELAWLAQRMERLDDA